MAVCRGDPEREETEDWVLDSLEKLVILFTSLFHSQGRSLALELANDHVIPLTRACALQPLQFSFI